MTTPAYLPTARPPRVGMPLPRFDKEDTRRRIRLVDMPELAQRIGVSGLHRVGRDSVGCCPLPGHDDGDPSCHFYSDPARGWFCFGCQRGGDAIALLQWVFGYSFLEALAYLGIGDGPRRPLPQLAPRRVQLHAARPTHPPRTPDQVYDYDGVYQVCRWNLTPAEQPDYGNKTKLFGQRRPDGRGGWAWNLDGVAPRLYHQAALAAADPGAPVYICEGEKDTDALRALGYVATCNSGGAGRWPAAHSPLLAGRPVVLFPDNDPAGQQHVADVAASIRPYAASIKIVTLPGLPSKGDVSDFLAAGWHPDAIRALVAVAPPLPAVDPGTGELLTTDPAPAEVVTALLDQVSALTQEVALLQAWQQRARTLFGNDQLDTAHRLALFGVWEVASERQIAPGDEAEINQGQIAVKCGQSKATVSRALAAFREMGVVKYDVRRIPEVRTNRDGAKYTHWDTYSTLTLTERVFEPQALSSPISPRAKTGSRHGGYRESCPRCHADGELQEDVRRCLECGYVYRPVDLAPAPDADDPALHDANTGACHSAAPKLPDATQDQPGEDLDVLSCQMQLRQPPGPAPSAILPGGLVDTRRAAAASAARAAHMQRYLARAVEAPPHPADRSAPRPPVFVGPLVCTCEPFTLDAPPCPVHWPATELEDRA